ncbi:MAG TPA: multiprotein bridging factor aMBF1 [Candidatus Nanoarchaeia archaeon]|nr:multiprotein bridging factor aMBF1 [Candidatus Nanoarchaeia archaeon]
MSTCDLCGKGTATMKAIVEGSMLHVCNNCSKYGNVVSIQEPPRHQQEKIKKLIEEPATVRLIVKDYAKKIKDAREQQKITQEALALRIKEKESYLHKIESGHLEPNLLTARRLEQALTIKIIEDYQQQPTGKIDMKEEALTIGDLITIKKKK